MAKVSIVMQKFDNNPRWTVNNSVFRSKTFFPCQRLLNDSHVRRIIWKVPWFFQCAYRLGCRKYMLRVISLSNIAVVNFPDVFL